MRTIPLRLRAARIPPHPLAGAVTGEADQPIFLVAIERDDRVVQTPLRILV
jgi:hypothetical protein